MDIKEFRNDFIQDVKATAENSLDNTTAAFVEVAAAHLFNAEIISDFYPSFYIGTYKGNKKCRVDAYMHDEWDNSFTLIIADFSGKPEADTITFTEANMVLGRAAAFVDAVILHNLREQIEISLPAYDLATEMLDSLNRKNLKKIKIILVTDKVASSRINNVKNSKVSNINLEYHIWDINRFFKIATSKLGKQEIEIDLCQYTHKGLPCLEASETSTNEYKSYLCVIPGEVLADIYDEYGSLLLEGNVRSFLSVRGKVNKAIRGTILSNERAPLFFCLNNGISVTATKVEVSKSIDGAFLTKIHNMQIVNGGQTTASLANTRYKDNANLDKIFVQMKLTEVSNEKAEELIPQISKSANSQNKVSEADFFSNHPFHIRMEEFSRRKYAPATAGMQYETHWFYERARGQYTQMQMHKTKSQVGKFKTQNPRNQVITKTDIAKARNSWNRVPYIVSKGSQASFLHYAGVISEKWEKDDAVFNEVYFQETVALRILFKHLEKLVSNQPWYEGGYRANIVTYTIALFSELLIKQYPNMRFNLSMIWSHQEVKADIERCLTEVSKTVFEVITDDQRPVQNVTQWCKQKLCWDNVKKVKQQISGIDDYLESKVELKEEKRKARKEQKILSGIEAQIFVVELGRKYWSDMLQFGSLKNILASTDKNILLIASRMSSTRMPNSVHCNKLQILRERMMNEGFRSK